MALPGIPIPETQCIGDSLFSINNALTALDTAVTAAASSGVTQIVAGSNISISPTGGTGVVTINGAEAGASVTVSDTPPSGASAGDLWFDSSSGITSVFYDSTWIDVGGGDSGTSAGSVNGIVQCDGNGNFSAANLEALINNIIMEPTSSATITTAVTNQVITNSPAVLYSASIGTSYNSGGSTATISSGSSIVWRMESASYGGLGASTDNPSLPIGGIDCPNGIQVTTTGSLKFSIAYRLT